MTPDKDLLQTLSAESTGTITPILLKKGLRNVWFRGCRPLRSGLPRVVGPAFTMRFVPAREDLATPESWASPRSSRAAIEEMPEGVVAVADARALAAGAIFGDILTIRMHKRGVAGLVTDGTVRDGAGVIASNLPV